MSGRGGAFRDFPLEQTITERAAAAGIALEEGAVRRLALHARAVIGANERLRLTAVVDPEEFVERHLGEAFEGAALLPAEISGVLLDLGSGNGYPGLPLAAARPGLTAILAEASRGKSAFLADVVDSAGFGRARVLSRQVQRVGDLAGVGPLTVIATRAAGGWERIVPRLVPALSEGGRVLVWAGAGADTVRRRTVWRRLSLLARRALPGRDRSWVWMFAAAGSPEPPLATR